jgi:hypothetical protein
MLYGPPGKALTRRSSESTWHRSSVREVVVMTATDWCT